MKKLYVAVFTLFISILVLPSAAQVSTSGTSGLAPAYASLASAITDLNSIGTVTDDVVITLEGNEIAPLGGFRITATGTASFSITFEGAGYTITAAQNPLSPDPANGSTNDAVFKIIGGDYITLQNFAITENPLNTVLAVATNTMTEFGIALYGASTANGAKNNLIFGNFISLDAAYTQSIGIMSSSTFVSTATVSGAAPAAQTAVAGGENSDNRYYANGIGSAAFGIMLVAPPATSSFRETGNDIGGTSGFDGNFITYGNNATIAVTYPSAQTTAALLGGITVTNSVGVNVAYNTITSSLFFTTIASNGITLNFTGSSPAGFNFTNTVRNNIITVNSSASAGTAPVYGIDFGYGLNAGGFSSTLLGSNNTIDINQTTAAATTTAAMVGIKANYVSGSTTASSNTININQTHAFASTLSSALTGILASGVAIGTAAFSSNTITFTQVHQTTGATNVTSAINGILMGAAAVTIPTANLLSNTITVKQSLASSGTFGAGTVNYINVSGVAAGTQASYTTLNINSNNFNTLGSTIRYTGQVVGVNNDFTNTSALSISTNAVSIDRTGVAATYGIFSSAYTTAVASSTSTINGNNISLSGTMSGSTTVNAIQQLEGNSTMVKNITGNTINLSLPSVSAGAQNGVLFQTGLVLTGTTVGSIATNNITIATGGTNVSGVQVSGTGIGIITNINGNTFNLSSTSNNIATNLRGVFVNGGARSNVFNNNFVSLALPGVTTNSPRIAAIDLASGSTAANPHEVYSNTISNAFTFAGTGSAIVEGIFVGAVAANIYKNKIYGLTASTSNTATQVNGIRINGLANSVTNVYNNIIGFDNSACPNASSTDAVRGIVTVATPATTTFNVAYNTIYLAASPSAAVTNFGTSGINHLGNATATSGRLNLVNNIIVNKSTPKGTGLTVAIRRTLVATNNYGDATVIGTNNCNNNLLFAGTPGTANLIYFDGSNSDQTINAFRTRMGTNRDFNSVTEDPVFASILGANPNFLHFTLGTATLVEAGGKPWIPVTGPPAVPAITDDFDTPADTRCPGGGCPGSGGAPDIGADEFAGTCIPPSALPTGYSVGAYGVPTAGAYTGTFTAASPAPTGGYLIVRTPTNAQPAPVNGTTYLVGNGIGAGTVVGVGAGTTFTNTIAAGTYFYWLFAYNACSGSPSYTTTALVWETAACVAPAAQPTAIVVNPLSTNSITGSFTPVGGGGASGYVVIRTTSNAAPVPAPVDGITYTSSGTGVLVSAGTGTTFTATGLSAGTPYWFWVYAYNNLCYTPLPAYNTVGPLNGTATTFPCVQPLPAINTVGPTATYPTITAAIANLVSCSPLVAASNYVFELQTNYVSTTETFPITVPSSITGAYTSIIFRPAAAATGLSITSSNTAGTLLFQGASRISFDGRQAGTGSSQLSIQNTNVGSSFAIQFENGSSTDSIRFCNVRSVHNGTSGGGGTINFAQASSNILIGGSGAGTTITVASTVGLTAGSTVTVTGGTGAFAANTTVSAILSSTQFTVSGIPTTALASATISAIGGNSNIVIENNNIFEATGGTLPTTSIYSNGSTTGPNNSVKISNNNIYNFFNATFTTAGINLAANSNTWTINGNSFYQTATRTFTSTTANFNAILSSATSNNGLIIQDNFIGGTAASVGGTAMTINGNGVMRAIQLTTGATASSVQNNVIRNISYTSSNSSSLHSLISLVGGVINVGTVAGNVLGNSTGTASIGISLSDNTAGVGFAAISGQSVAATDIFNIRNNNIGSITVAGTSTTASIRGILMAGSGTARVIGNNIGSTVTANSFVNNLNSTITGIYGNASSTATTLTAGSSAGTTITVASTAALVAGSTVTVTAGTGAFAPNTIVLSVVNATQFTVSVAPTTALSGATISIPSQTISGNSIANVTAANSGASSYAGGIYVGNTGLYAVGDIVNGGNTIFNINSAGTNVLSYNATGISSFTSTAGQSIQGNTIYNVVATAGGAIVGVVGIYSGSTSTGANNNIERNLVHSLNILSSNTGSSIAGIQVDGSGTANVQNNMVRLGITSTGAQISNAYSIYGIAEYAGTNRIYMNSVYIGGTGVGSGSDSYAYYGLNGGNKDVQNNIFWNARSNASASSPNHFATVLVNNSGTVDFNDILATGTGKTLGLFSSTPYLTLATWRTNSGEDANSVSSLPRFLNPTAAVPDLHVDAAQLTLVEAGGTVIAASPSNDFDNETRASFTPVDLGADAINGLSATRVDLGVTALVAPPSSGCYGSSQTITVTLRNFGSLINFVTNPVTVNVQVTGPVNVSIPITINTGTLGAGASANYTAASTLNMSGIGVYNFACTFTVGGGALDADMTNDEFNATRTTAVLAIGSAFSSPSSFCGATSGSPRLSLSSVSGGTVQWWVSSDNVTFTPIAASIDSTSYSPGVILATTYYFARVSCGVSNLTSNTVTVLVSNPTVLSASISGSDSSCGPASFTFTGTVNAGSTLRWYDAASGGLLVGSGSPFVSPVLNRTTTYYSKAESIAGAPATADFGTLPLNSGTTNTTTGYPAPYTNWYGGTKHQMLILASELGAAGVSPGNITSVTFYVASVGSTFSGSLTNFTVHMGSTTSAALTSTFESAPTLVYSNASQAIFPGPVTHVFTTPFNWDGSSNILLQTSYSNGNFGGSNDNVQMYYSTTGFNSTNYYRVDLQSSAAVLAAGTGNGTSPTSPTTRRPNMTLGYTALCTNPGPSLTATISQVPTPVTITPSAASICPGVSGSDQVNLVATGGIIQPTGAAVFSNTTSVAIPDVNSTGVSSTINVSGIPLAATIDSVRVSINVGMTWISDIMLNLQSPNGQIVNLVSNRGGSGDNFSNTVISSAPGNASFATGAPPFSGLFAADGVTAVCGSGPGCFQISPVPLPTTNSFSALTTGITGNGNWILRAYDDEGAITGSITNWTITVYYKDTVKPSTYLWTPATGLFTDNSLGTAYTTGNTTSVFAAPSATSTYTITATNGPCSSTQNAVVTVNSLSAVATSLSATPSTSCAGANVTLTQTGGTLGTGATWKWYTDAAFTTPVGGITGVGAAATATVTPIANTTYYLRAEGGTSPCTGNVASPGSVAVTINPTGNWLGVDNNWNNAANWCGGVPTAATDVTIPTSGNYPNITGITASANNITLTGSGTVTIGSTGILQVAGTFTSPNNAIDATAGTLELIGTAAQTIRANHFNSASIANLIISNTSAGGATIDNTGSMLNITNEVNFGNNNNQKFNTSNLLTLRSTATATARVADVTLNGTRTGNDVIGKVVIERFIPSRRAWRLLTAPIRSSTIPTPTIFNNWQEGARSFPLGTLADPAPGFGTHVSNGNNVPDFDQNNTYNSSIFYLTPTGWNGRPTNTSGTTIGANVGVITDQPGYMLFVRGNRSTNLALGTFAPSSATTLRTTGDINVTTNAAAPLVLTPGGGSPVGANFNFVFANPYPSAISFEALRNEPLNAAWTLNNTFYVWDANLTGTNGVGGFITVTRTSPGIYATSPTASIPGLISGHIQSGMAFVVLHTANVAPSVRYKESFKVSGSNISVLRPHNSQIRTTLIAKNADGTSSVNDGALVYFDGVSSNEVDNQDGFKIPNFAENLCITNNGIELAIEKRKSIAESDTIFLRLSRMRTKQYILSFDLAGLSQCAEGKVAILEDCFLDTKTVLDMDGNTEYNFTVAQNTPSADSGRFRIVFKKIVQFAGIKAAVLNDDVAVDWNISTELNIDRYEVERSANGTSFESIGNQLSRGNTEQGAGYSWLDVYPPSGIYYYRIKAIGKNGTVLYSDIARVTIIKRSPSIFVFPNPVTNNVIGLQLTKMPEGLYEAVLMSADGKVISKDRFMHAGGTSTEKITPRNLLPSGNYRIEVTAPDKTRTIVSVMVQKQ